jgi:hypothetical protein
MGVNKEENYKLILFQSTHHSIKAEKALMENEVLYRMAAVPPEISSDCGSAVTVTAELEEIINLFKEKNILVEAVYEVKKEAEKKEFKKIYSRE